MIEDHDGRHHDLFLSNKNLLRIYESRGENMNHESSLKKRCQATLYSLYQDSLPASSQNRFERIKESDPYLNQIIDEVMHYVVYDLPLQPIILEVIQREKHAHR